MHEYHCYVVIYDADTIDKSTSDALIVESADVVHVYASTVKRRKKTKLKNISSG